MLSNNTFLENRIQRLLDGLIFVEKGLGVHVQHMLKMSRDLYTGGNFKQNTWKKTKENWGPYLLSLFDILTSRCQLIFLLEYIMRSLLARLPPLHSEKDGTFFEFSLYFYYKLCHYRSTKNAY